MNLFVITAPYQMLSVLEAVHHLQLKDNHLWVTDTGHFTRKQFESVIDQADWTSVRFHNFRYLLPDRDFGADPPATAKDRLIEIGLVADQALKRWRANRIAHSFASVDYLLMGNYRRHYDGHMRHLANRLRYNRLVLLDVGTDTLRVNRDRHADKARIVDGTVDESVRGFKALKQWIKHRWVAWDTRGEDTLTFFTAYDLDLAPGDQMIRNRYTYLQSVVADARPSSKVLFVGQPLVDQQYISDESFIDIMSRVKAYFATQQLVYIPHPRESENQLQVIRKLGIAIEQFTAPFEYAVSFSGERPYGVAAFFSSVVENSAIIFGEALRLWAFRLPEAMLMKDQESINQLYCHFAANKQAPIEVVDV